jgi:hypothetical protein
MKRREFITLIGGATAAWPLAARAQQGERMRRIGVLAGGAVASDADTQERNAVFAKSLQELGWVIGRNVQIDFRYGLGDAANVRKYAEELVALAPDVVLASGASALVPRCARTNRRGSARMSECGRSLRTEAGKQPKRNGMPTAAENRGIQQGSDGRLAFPAVLSMNRMGAQIPLNCRRLQ